MKTLLLFLLTILSFSFKSQATDYRPFPTTNATWVYQYYDDFHHATGGFTSYNITGDTMILGRNYKKISGCTVWGSCNSGGIRDSNKVIYFIPDTSSTEYVLYNFNLNIGDTLFNPFGDSSGFQNIIVWDSDSVLASDGFHRRLHFNTFDMWIEGIGSTSYFFSPTGFMGLSGNDNLECMMTDSGFAYPDWIGSCIMSIPNQSNLKNLITISPNPFQSSTVISLQPEFENSHLEIYNALGVLVREEIVSNRKSFVLYRDDLEAGIYFLKLLNQTGELATRKFIID